MAVKSKKAAAKTVAVRVVCITLAALMILSVVLATVWRW